MADDGLTFTADDTDFTAKMNRKSLVVGRGSQLANLTTTYGGQIAYSTVTENGFTIDKFYVRDTANSAWFNKKNITETAETVLNTPVADNTVGDVSASKYYSFFTMPSTEKFYMVTAIEYNGSTTGGNVLMGVEFLNANPPTLDPSLLVALSQETAVVTGIKKVSVAMSKPILAGAFCGAWITRSAVGNVRIKDPNSTKLKTVTYTADQPTQDTTAFSASSYEAYLKVYGRGYNYA